MGISKSKDGRICPCQTADADSTSSMSSKGKVPRIIIPEINEDHNAHTERVSVENWLKSFVDFDPKNLDPKNVHIIFNLILNRKTGSSDRYSNLDLVSDLLADEDDLKSLKSPANSTILQTSNSNSPAPAGANNSGPNSPKVSKLVEKKHLRSKSIYIASKSPDKDLLDSTDRLKFSYSVFLNSIYDGLTFMPLIYYTIEYLSTDNLSETNFPKKRLIIFNILNKSVRGKNIEVFTKFKQYITGLNSDQQEILLKSSLEKEYFDLSQELIKILESRIQTIQESLIYYFRNRTVRKDNFEKIIELFSNLLVRPKVLLEAYKSNVAFTRKILINFIYLVREVLKKEDVKTYGWEYAFSERDLNFLRLINSEINLELILDFVHRTEYAKLFFKQNQDPKNVSIFLNLFELDLKVITDLLFLCVQPNQLMEVFKYSYNLNKLFTLCTLVFHRLKMAGSILDLKKDLTFPEITRKASTVELLKDIVSHFLIISI